MTPTKFRSWLQGYLAAYNEQGRSAPARLIKENLASALQSQEEDSSGFCQWLEGTIQFHTNDSLLTIAEAQVISQRLGDGSSEDDDSPPPFVRKRPNDGRRC